MKIKREIKKVEEELVGQVFRCANPACYTPCYVIRTFTPVRTTRTMESSLGCVYEVRGAAKWEEIPPAMEKTEKN